jgi:cell fate regulator YaaT (PSP1 superfamily)
VNGKRKKFSVLMLKNQAATEEKIKIKKPASEYQPPAVILPEELVVEPVPEEPEEFTVIGVRFKDGGKVYYFDPGQTEYRMGDEVIVDTSRGLEFGQLACENKVVKISEVVLPLRRAIRKATEQDREHKAENDKKEIEALEICEQLIQKHNLEMKLVEAEITFDNTKILFYFTSDTRVDFRELVKDLAGVFRTRIELRQIGIRDEAKITGGLGICGRTVCCKSFLEDFGQVSIKMAKEQNLSLNTSKISGTCGRLMCCLRFEHETYEEEIRKTPKIDSLVRTADGDGTVVETAPLQGLIKVRLTQSPDAAPKVYHRDDVKLIGYIKKEQNKQPNE